MGSLKLLPTDARVRNAARRLLWLVGMASLCLTSSCAGWIRAQGGGAGDLQNRNDFSGPYAGIDGAIGTKYLHTGESPLRFALHMSADAIVAPERKLFGWGTGIVMYEEPRPISPYVILGTSGHADQIGNRFSFGNLSPYGELGLRTSIPARHLDGGNGWFTSLGVGAASSFNFLVGGTDTVDGFLLMKLGVGYELN
jgi:hypothetical protein